MTEVTEGRQPILVHWAGMKGRHPDRADPGPSHCRGAAQAAPPAHGCANCGWRARYTFCDLPPDALAALDRVKSSHTMRAGSAITVEGDASRGVHILCSGRAKFTTCSRGGRALIVRLAEAGEVIGLCDVIANRPFESNAITLEPAEVAFVSRADLSRLLGSYPAVRRAVAMELSNQYNAAYSEIRCLSRSRSAAHRLAAFLLQWFNRDNWSEMNLPLTHEELGELIGASRETVTRALSVFSRRGAVEARDGQVRLRNRAVLGSILGQ